MAEDLKKEAELQEEQLDEVNGGFDPYGHQKPGPEMTPTLVV